VIGVAGGVAVEFAGRFVLARARLTASGLYPVLSLAVAFLAFGAPAPAASSTRSSSSWW
jgi:cell volume regulation protein A